MSTHSEGKLDSPPKGPIPMYLVNAECVTARLAVSEVVERTLSWLTTAEQIIASNGELIRELEEQLAKADANCKLLSEQPRARELRSSFRARFVYNVVCQ